MRLHHRYRWSLILLPVVLAGCSTTVGSRFGKTAQSPSQSQSRSIAVVGDRPLPATTGEPGSQVAADVVEPEPKRNPKTRISGRVVDEQGRPVPDVTVRLADGGTKGGKDVSVTTDKSGAFTLNGLRPGSTYWLVAEADDDRGPLTGRVQARTAETGVEISLVGEGSGAASTRRSARPSRARPISSREELDENPADREPSGVNAEDVSPPAEDAGPIDPGPSSKSRSGRPQLSAPEPAVGWRNSKAAKPARPVDPDGETVASSSDDPPRRPRAATDSDPSSEDDGPNPLPPAINSNGSPDSEDADTKPTPSARANLRRKVSAKVPSPRPESGEIALAPEASLDEKPNQQKARDPAEAELTVTAGLLPMTPLLPDLSPRPKSNEPIVTTGTPGLLSMPAIGDPIAAPDAPKATASPPGAVSASQNIVSIKPASEPVFASQPIAPKVDPTPEPPAEYNPFALASATPLVPTVTKAASSVSPPDVPANPDGSQDAAPAPKKKWGELAATDKPTLVVEPTKATSPMSFVRRLRSPVEKHDPSVSTCSYDSRLQKINELRLPDLEGKPVRLQDLDADFVLLDFWGTWFPPCVDAIPHLVALQKKYGPDRLKVVGIACEKVPPAQRRARVDEVSQKLGINYAVLLSGMDGKPCPVLQTLQVQVYPTMILVDREGHIRWRSVGATPATEERLDRVLASTMSRTPTARR